MKIFTWLMLCCLSFPLMAQQQAELTLLSNLPYPEGLSSLIAYHAPDGTEYAIVGTTTRVSIVNLADPANPVEVASIPGPNTSWREMKVWEHYAYVSLDAVSDGFLIIDLANLPSADLPYYYWKPQITINGTTQTLQSTHTVSMTADGFLIMNGTNIGAGECLLFSLAPDPYHPTYLGHTRENTTNQSWYCHDSFSRNDTLWSSDIENGWFSVYDIHDKANPQYITRQSTPMNFTHNSWLSDDSKTLFTTDERSDSWITAYDVSDLTDIKELDRWRRKATEGTGVIIHNVHVWNDFIVTAHYTDGVTIVDGSRPDNLIEVANYDTYPQAGIGFNGVWGVEPYFQSGIIAASDIDNGLFVFQPTYVRACYLEGNVTDAATGAPLQGVTVTINSTLEGTSSNLVGDYKTGYRTAGEYTVTFSKAGYASQTLPVALVNGEVVILNVAMGCNGITTGGQVQLADGNDASAAVISLSNGTATYTFIADAQGNFSTTCLPSGTYTLTVGKWGWRERQYANVLIDGSTPLPELYLGELGYFDSFVLDMGWTTETTASSGAWVRGEPVGTVYQNNTANPDNDVTTDIGDQCYVTGNGGGGAGSDDVDNGTVRLLSPLFTLMGSANIMSINFKYWFFNVGGSDTPNDTLKVKITDGTTTITLANYTASQSAWQAASFWLTEMDEIDYSAPLRLIFETADAETTGHIVEAAIDDINIHLYENTLHPEALRSVVLMPNPCDTKQGATFAYEVVTPMQTHIMVKDILGRTVYQTQQSGTAAQVALPTLPTSGIYTVQLWGDGKLISTHKLIAQ